MKYSRTVFTGPATGARCGSRGNGALKKDQLLFHTVYWARAGNYNLLKPGFFWTFFRNDLQLGVGDTTLSFSKNSWIFSKNSLKLSQSPLILGLIK